MNEELKELKERARRAMGLYGPSACDLVGRLLLALEAAEQQVAEAEKRNDGRIAELYHATQAILALREENAHLWVRIESGEAAAYEQGKHELLQRICELEAERDGERGERC